MALEDLYTRLDRLRPILNRLMPRRPAAALAGYEREHLVGHRYFVLVAHTKTALDFAAITAGLSKLRDQPGVELVSLTELAVTARTELEGGPEAASDRVPPQPPLPDALMPLDRERVVDAAALGLGLAPEGEFDCVEAKGSLERASDVDGALADAYRALADGGCLIAAILPDGLNPGRTCVPHAWKPLPSDVSRRLEAAGFVDVEIRSADMLRELGLPPYPPSNDRLLYVRAWKRGPAASALDRLTELTRWAYETLDPERPQESNDPVAILAGGHAWCWGYVVVLGEALRRESYELRWVTMIAEDHPLGLGDRRRDSHEVLEVVLAGGRRVVCDPMVGIVFEASLSELLDDPARADTPRPEDDRYHSRNYALYSTSEWYGRVRRVAIRTRPGGRLRYVDPRRLIERSRG
jgi:SAM-dependent methyltransferase